MQEQMEKRTTEARWVYMSHSKRWQRGTRLSNCTEPANHCDTRRLGILLPVVLYAYCHLYSLVYIYALSMGVVYEHSHLVAHDARR